MRKRTGFIFVFAVLLGAVSAHADFISTVNKGNEAYRRKDYKSALDMYHSAETDRPESPELKYNIAGALNQQGDYQAAIDQYQGAIKSPDINLEAQAHYNLGNTYYRMKDYQNAIKAYEESLKLNPKDMDAKFNLELARKMLKEQISPQNQQNQKDQQQNQKDQQQKQGNDQQDKKDQQNQQNQQDKQDKQDKNQQQQQQSRPKDDKKMSKEDAERILNALRDDEQQIQKKVKREQGQGDYLGKDW